MFWERFGEKEMNFILATKNQGKVKELQAVIREDHTILTLADIGFDENIIENGQTYEENAIIKAKAIKAYLPDKYKDWHVLADDSGLEIEALDGEPGVQTANWFGDIAQEEKCQKVIELMADKKNRCARFVCVLVCIEPDGNMQKTKGFMFGKIAHEIKGANGFGYDPIFYAEDMKCTVAELNEEVKNAISHRAQALTHMRLKLGIEVNWG